MTETEQMWSERVAAWKASGQTPEAFTQGEPYAPSTLRWWSSRLRRRVKTSPTTTRKTTRRTPFVQMAKVVRKSESAEPVVVIEVGAARIIVGERFDAPLLARVVSALGGHK